MSTQQSIHPSNCRYESNFIGTAEHGGTHLDAPAHFNKGKWRTHSIPVENLVGPGVIIDVKSKAALNPDYLVAIDDLKQWEIMYGRIPDRAVVFMNSGWHERYPNATLVFNSDDPTNPTTYHFPSWHEDTISWLISERSVVIVGVDTPSVDEGQSTIFPVHTLLGAADICGAENVANLDMVSNSGSVIVVAVMKIFDGSGGPARIIATVPQEGESCGLNTYSWLLLIVIFLISIMIILKRLSTHS